MIPVATYGLKNRLTFFYKISYVIILSVFLAGTVLSQVPQPDDTSHIKEFEVVHVRDRHLTLHPEITLQQEEIEKLSPQDLGHLLQQVAGVTLRSYGGLGGMKTVALRGLGGEHTQLIINGLPVNNAQNAQTDFGLIQLENISEVQITNGIKSDPLLPVSSQLMGNSIALQTNDHHFSASPLQVRANTLLGSFGQYEGHVGVKNSRKKHYIGANAKYRNVEGSYPYRIKMGTQTHEYERRNNAFDEYFVSLGAGYKSNGDSTKTKHIAHFFGQYDKADKELPGAVILYNDLADETLLTENLKTGGNYTLITPKSKLRFFGVYNRQFIHYHDPSFFNKEGFLDNQYTNNNISSGLNLSRKFNTITATIASEYAHYDLNSNRNTLGTPQRTSTNTMVDLAYTRSKLLIKGALFHQHITDYNRKLNHSTINQRWNPQIGIYSNPNNSKKMRFYLWYKQSMRPPSFNELYYSQIGTLSLEPEETKQLNLGANYNTLVKKADLSLRFNTYYNHITNKILALPTKNLFVWSIQNIGEVQVIGGDIQLNYHYYFSKNTSFQFNTTFTHQHIVDISNPTSPTYRHQLAYTPVNTGNTTFSFYHKKVAFHNQLFYTGKRFSLNQNIVANELPSFLIWDASASYLLKIKEKQHVKIQAGIRNITNSNYAFIRYFMMPGRNYFFKISYEFN